MSEWEEKHVSRHEDGKPYWITLVEPGGWWRAEVKWDGCVHFYRYFNYPLEGDPEKRTEDVDYMHLCSVNETIEKLTALRDAAQAAGMWPAGKDNDCG